MKAVEEMNHENLNVAEAPIYPIIPCVDNEIADFRSYDLVDSFFYDWQAPYEDYVYVVFGPRGGGKTATGVGLHMFDGMLRGIPCISNVPIQFPVWDKYNSKYLVQSEPFDPIKFAMGDNSLMNKRLLIDEGNYELDRLRSTSTKNLALTDILQQARKFQMSIVFCTINYNWLDPRVTGSLCDIGIKCRDLHFTPWGRKNGIKKGSLINWEATDMSGKYTGFEESKIADGTFWAELIWGSYNTMNFVDPLASRKRLNLSGAQAEKELTRLGYDGDKLSAVKHKLMALQLAVPDKWDKADLFDSLGIYNDVEQQALIPYFKTLGVSFSRDKFDLTALNTEGLKPKLDLIDPEEFMKSLHPNKDIN